MNEVKELCKRVLASNLTDEDKVEIIVRLNKSDNLTVQPPLYRDNEINPLNRGIPSPIPLNHSGLTYDRRRVDGN